jgi:hypothetical protein
VRNPSPRSPRLPVPGSALAQLVLAVALLLLVAPSAHAQMVKSLFAAGQSADGYYVPFNGTGKLEVGVLAELGSKRPITLGARIEVNKQRHAVQERSFATDVELVAAGRRGSGGRDQWYLQGFVWTIGCSADGREVEIGGEVAGASPLDLVIEVGVAMPREAGEALSLVPDSIAESSVKRVVCGEYAPLPKP